MRWASSKRRGVAGRGGTELGPSQLAGALHHRAEATQKEHLRSLETQNREAKLALQEVVADAEALLAHIRAKLKILTRGHYGITDQAGPAGAGPGNVESGPAEPELAAESAEGETEPPVLCGTAKRKASSVSSVSSASGRKRHRR